MLALFVVLLAAGCSGEREQGVSSASPRPSPGTTTVARCPPTARPDVPGPANQDRPLSDPLAVAMDAQSGRLVAVETRPQATGTTARTWTFDVCTNRWQRMRLGAAPRQVRMIVYDADSDLTVAFPVGIGARPWAYSVEQDTWRQQPPAKGPAPTLDHLTDAVYDATTGRVLLRAVRGEALWAYDVDANTWAEVEQGATVPEENLGTFRYGSLLASDPVAGRLVLTRLGDEGRPGETWTFDLRAHVWQRKRAVPPVLNIGFDESGREVTFDAAAARTVVFSGGVLGTYDATADRWHTSRGGRGWPTPTNMLARTGHSLAYDLVNRRVLLVGGTAPMSGGGFTAYGDLWALDLPSETWTEPVPGLR